VCVRACCAYKRLAGFEWDFVLWGRWAGLQGSSSHVGDCRRVAIPFPVNDHKVGAKAMSECWAASLGDCAGKISREHLVTKGTFAEDEVFVHGFDWCRDAPVKIGLASLTAKILCEKHNSALSAADNAGIRTVECLREFFRLADVRVTMKSRRWRVVRLKTDGFELERWFLKTLTNVALGRQCPLDKANSPKWNPSRELVEVAFGLRRFEHRAGLYLLYGQGQHIDANAKFQIVTFYNAANRLVGAQFIMFGFDFLIYLEKEGLSKRVQFAGSAGPIDAPASEPIYRPGAIRYNTSKKHLSHVLQIDWTSGDSRA
jgi:hypothetical protein